MATSTVWINTTTTLPVGTITISTSSGFVPIASNIPTNTPTKKRSALLQRRGQLAPFDQLRPRKQDTSPSKHSLEDDPEDGSQNVTLTLESGKVHHKPAQFPKAVSCDETIAIFSISTITKLPKQLRPSKLHSPPLLPRLRFFAPQQLQVFLPMPPQLKPSPQPLIRQLP